MALQSIQASLAALHERLNRVESNVPGRSSDDPHRRRGTGSSSAARRLLDAFSNAIHDLRQLIGLESTAVRSPRSEALAPSFLANGGNPNGRQAAAVGLLSAPIRVLAALVNLVARLALDVVSLALVSSFILFLVKRVTGRGDPLIVLRFLTMLRRAILRRPGSTSSRAIEAAPVAN